MWRYAGGVWTVLALVGAFTAAAVAYAHFTGEERARRTSRRAPATPISSLREDVRGKLVGRTRAVDDAVHEGEPIAVLGAGTREPDPDAAPADSYRGDAPTRLRLTSSARYPLVISDDPAALT